VGKSDAAIPTRFEKVLLALPNDRNILEALASFHTARGGNAEAKSMSIDCRRSKKEEE
jgi:hypothetical protein